MTITQMQYILEVSACGSISAAAKKLFVTQSYLSTLLKNAEQETGITIFLRSRDGILPTPDGAEFLRHVETILSSYASIEQLSAREEKRVLRVACADLSVFSRAFVRLCQARADSEKYSLSLETLKSEACLQALQARQCQCAGILIPAAARNRVTEQLREAGLKGEWMGEIGYDILVRKDHPLLRQWEPGTPFPYRAIVQYTFVDTPSLRMREMTIESSYPFFPAIASRYIRVPDRISRNEILRATDAFSMTERGCLAPDSGDLTAIPIPEYNLDVCCCVPGRSSGGGLVREFLDLVREEIRSSGKERSGMVS